MGSCSDGYFNGFFLLLLLPSLISLLLDDSAAANVVERQSNIFLTRENSFEELYSSMFEPVGCVGCGDLWRLPYTRL